MVRVAHVADGSRRHSEHQRERRQSERSHKLGGHPDEEEHDAGAEDKGAEVIHEP